MSDESSSQASRRNRFQFSLGSMMLLTAVFALSIALVLVYSRLQKAERALDALQPMSAEEVAQQFEVNTNLVNVETKVNDVRFSPSENAFRVEFSWTDPQTKSMWSTDVKLVSDGFGVYYGKIFSSEFLKAVGASGEYYVVAVKTPSPLKAK
jgi:hypothetical protein